MARYPYISDSGATCVAEGANLVIGQYDYETIHAIVDQTPILHVSFNPVAPDESGDLFPTILPMLGCTGPLEAPTPQKDAEAAPGSFPQDEPSLPDGPRVLYLHGYVSSRLMRLPNDSGASKGTPICIAASELNGVVLALTPFHHSCNYRSAIIHGYATAVTEEGERSRAMELITDNIVAYRWNNSRVPPTKAELTSTGILRVEIASASAKIRVGGPGDDRHDLKDPNVIGNIWTGVVPAFLQYGDPVASNYNEVKKVPTYLTEWVKEENTRNKKVAMDAIAAAKK